MFLRVRLHHSNTSHKSLGNAYHKSLNIYPNAPLGLIYPVSQRLCICYALSCLFMFLRVRDDDAKYIAQEWRAGMLIIKSLHMPEHSIWLTYFILTATPLRTLSCLLTFLGVQDDHTSIPHKSLGNVYNPSSLEILRPLDRHPAF